MATSSDDEKKEKRPRGVIHETQEQCLDWQDLCMNIHQGIGRVDAPVAIRGFHNAVLRYWSILRTYGDESSVKGMWKDDDLLGSAPFEVGDHTVETLADVGRLRYASDVKVNVSRDPVNGARRKERPTAAFLEPHQASEIFDALNDISKELGFTAKPGTPVEDDPAPV